MISKKDVTLVGQSYVCAGSAEAAATAFPAASVAFVCALGTTLLGAERCWRSLGDSNYGAHAWFKVKEGPA